MPRAGPGFQPSSRNQAPSEMAPSRTGNHCQSATSRPVCPRRAAVSPKTRRAPIPTAPATPQCTHVSACVGRPRTRCSSPRTARTTIPRSVHRRYRAGTRNRFRRGTFSSAGYSGFQRPNAIARPMSAILAKNQRLCDLLRSSPTPARTSGKRPTYAMTSTEPSG